MQTFSQIVYIAKSWKLGIAGKYFRILDSLGSVDVNFYKANRLVYQASGVDSGFYAMPAEGFDMVEIVSGGMDQLVKIAVSDGTGGYDRYNGTVNLEMGTSVVNTGLVNINTVSTAVVAASAVRKGVRFLNSGATVIYLGGAGVDAANGCVKLNAGDLWVESEAPGAAWYAVSTSGAGSLKVQELL